MSASTITLAQTNTVHPPKYKIPTTLLKVANAIAIVACSALAFYYNPFWSLIGSGIGLCMALGLEASDLQNRGNELDERINSIFGMGAMTLFGVGMLKYGWANPFPLPLLLGIIPGRTLVATILHLAD